MAGTNIPFPSSQEPTGKPPVVNALILINGKFPLLKRSKGGESWWDLPGGKPDDAQETYADTILRELLEEIGITAKVVGQDPVDEIPHPYLKGETKVFLKCDYVSGEPHNCLPAEHEELRLARADEAIALLGNRISPKVAQAMRDMEAATVPSRSPKSHSFSK